MGPPLLAGAARAALDGRAVPDDAAGRGRALAGRLAGAAAVGEPAGAAAAPVGGTSVLSPVHVSAAPLVQPTALLLTAAPCSHPQTGWPFFLRLRRAPTRPR